jgi:hypothetical protein
MNPTVASSVKRPSAYFPRPMPSSPPMATSITSTLVLRVKVLPPVHGECIFPRRHVPNLTLTSDISFFSLLFNPAPISAKAFIHQIPAATSSRDSTLSDRVNEAYQVVQPVSTSATALAKGPLLH